MPKFNGIPLFGNVDSLTGRLNQLHGRILESVSGIARIACALYDPNTDLLKTFINSTHTGHAIVSYEYPLSESHSLLEMSKSGTYRIIDDIAEEVSAGTAHSNWLLEQGYSSSFTLPMFNDQRLLGFIFVDSNRCGVFTDAVQRDLVMFCNTITMTIATEISALQALLATAQAVREFANLRDFETGKHLTRMAQFSRLIAKEVAEHYGLSDEKIEHIYLFASLHDIGKIGIPDKILLKQGRLDQDERVIMQGHVHKGVQIIQKVLEDYQLGHLNDAKVMLNIVACHHEFLDGTGYPNGLKADQIPVEARIVTVADIFDALTSNRPYKTPWEVHEAIAELERMAEIGKLDPACVAALKKQQEKMTQIVIKFRDEKMGAVEPRAVTALEN
ncbi:metal dependent phosphohydrolase [Marinobacterium halophilum]|uniref:Metal dependent phosphohydrolase n=1 Tax=Marinobacterium halophilum TaxID=267374 RepID=A0A2P8F4U8_9GAMM|nr:HD domain-containing phosphohydrolase [Marinobacterium halophilum]PSL16742.1 metal dependent phosphohydrolase [Marinobacterium halophilum]